jgi:hypothetical protein
METCLSSGKAASHLKVHGCRWPRRLDAQRIGWRSPYRARSRTQIGLESRQRNSCPWRPRGRGNLRARPCRPRCRNRLRGIDFTGHHSEGRRSRPRHRSLRHRPRQWLERASSRHANRNSQITSRAYASVWIRAAAVFSVSALRCRACRSSSDIEGSKICTTPVCPSTLGMESVTPYLGLWDPIGMAWRAATWHRLPRL